MSTWSNEENPRYLFADDAGSGPKPETAILRTGRDSVLQWMQLCIKNDAVKIEETKKLNLGSDHEPAWIATRYLYASYLATCRQQGRAYPVNKELFGMMLTDILGPCQRSTTTPEDLAKTMFGEKRPRRPLGHLIPNGKTWQELLDARLHIPKQKLIKLIKMAANELSGSAL
jgi:phage/plasmid-associated DNA primase